MMNERSLATYVVSCAALDGILMLNFIGLFELVEIFVVQVGIFLFLIFKHWKRMT
jgi:hypothetical protein